MDTTPSAHVDRKAPAVMAALDPVGNENSTPGPPGLSAGRGFRAVPVAAQAQPIALGDTQQVRAEKHAGPGSPDPRRNDHARDGYLAGDTEAATMPVQYVNVSEPVVKQHVEQPPARARQGWTGDDPARAATFRRAYVMRPFDQWAAQHPGSVEKAALARPLAASSPDYPELVGGLPGAMGTAGSARAGFTLSRNTFRLVPRPWDAGFLVPEVPADAVATHGRAFR